MPDWPKKNSDILIFTDFMVKNPRNVKQISLRGNLSLIIFN